MKSSVVLDKSELLILQSALLRYYQYEKYMSDIEKKSGLNDANAIYSFSDDGETLIMGQDTGIYKEIAKFKIIVLGKLIYESFENAPLFIWDWTDANELSTYEDVQTIKNNIIQKYPTIPQDTIYTADYTLINYIFAELTMQLELDNIIVSDIDEKNKMVLGYKILDT